MYFSHHGCAIHTNSAKSQTPIPLKNWVLHHTSKESSYSYTQLWSWRLLRWRRKPLTEKEDREEEEGSWTQGRNVAGHEPREVTSAGEPQSLCYSVLFST